MQAKGRDSVFNHKVDRLVLHQSSPSSSLSNVPPLEQDVGLHLKAGRDVATPAELQRPETSRGRQSRTCSARLKEAKSPSPSQESLAEDESSRRDCRSGRQRETCDLENRSLSEAEEAKEAKEAKEAPKVDQEVAKERERLKEAKQRRLRLLREELRREEEEEERKLKEEAEERRRWAEDFAVLAKRLPRHLQCLDSHLCDYPDSFTSCL